MGGQSSDDRWWERAECLGGETEMWFTESAFDAAVRVCATCAVVGECGEAASAEEVGQGRVGRFGVRGGLTPDERYRAERARVRAEIRAAVGP